MLKYLRLKPVKILLLAIFSFLCCTACDNQTREAAFSDCRYGKPEAIFNKSIEGINGHSFNIEKDKSIEQMLFGSGKKLTIIQSGCNSIKQEFRFVLNGKFEGRDPVFWVEQAVKQFQMLSQLGPEFVVYGFWAQAIAGKAEQIKLAQPTELQPGFFLSLDKILSEEHAILVLILSETV